VPLALPVLLAGTHVIASGTPQLQGPFRSRSGGNPSRNLNSRADENSDNQNSSMQRMTGGSFKTGAGYRQTRVFLQLQESPGCLCRCETRFRCAAPSSALSDRIRSAMRIDCSRGISPPSTGWWFRKADPGRRLYRQTFRTSCSNTNP